MRSPVAYLDSSAIVKLVAFEAETPKLKAYIDQRQRLVSSALARAETHRALWRVAGSRTDRARTDDVLARIALVRVDESVLDLAASLPPSELRTLDAIHLATALSFGPDLAELVTYDLRLASAALAAGLDVVSPR
ncbi:MAG TPA: type II toxin-antitoxin system VapC family toxin [Thermoanaerobaculia bacterium]|nr:type II toxin-antitoxin system VapC family toxin [Thermoanaerobaculia bacterium]